MKVAEGCLVELEYAIATPDGEVVESSEDAGNLEYVHGEGELPPALEAALLDKQAGDVVEVTLPPGEAFGEHNPDGIVTVPRGDFPPDAELVPGDWITVGVEDDGEEQGELEMRVVEIGPEAVVLDANHPLANETVTFRVKVVAVREAD